MTDQVDQPWSRGLYPECPGCGGAVHSLEHDGFCRKCSVGAVDEIAARLLIDPNNCPGVLKARAEAETYFRKLDPKRASKGLH